MAASSTAVVAVLYSEHHGWLHAWLDRRLGNRAVAADLSHDTFERILVAHAGAAAPADAPAPPRAPRAYLATIARHLLINHLRRQSLERAFLDALAALPEREVPSPEQQALVLEALEELDALLNRLPHKARLAFILAQVEGLAYAEIAVRMQASERSVKRWMAQALAECIMEAP